MNTSLSYITVKSHLVSQPINKSNSNDEIKINFTSLLHITWGIILILNLSSKAQTNF